MSALFAFMFGNVISDKPQKGSYGEPAMDCR